MHVTLIEALPTCVQARALHRLSALRKHVEKVRWGAKGTPFSGNFLPETGEKLSKTVKNFAADRSQNDVGRRFPLVDLAGLYRPDGPSGRPR